MRILIDTHIFIWHLEGDNKLSDGHRIRMIVAQCLVEDIPLISVDSDFSNYGVKLL